MNPPAPVRVGVVGLRFGGQVHVPAFRADARCEVVALAGTDPERTTIAANALGVKRSYADWRQLLAGDVIDAVSIAVPPSEQPAVIGEAARLGKHVFCEKPLAANLAAAERALDCVRRSGVAHAIDFIFPEIDAWRRARRLIEEGAIGAPRHFSYRWYVETVAVRTKTDSWKSRGRDGGGAVGNFLSHVIFNLEWLLGEVIDIETVRRRNVNDGALSCDCVAYLANGVHGPIAISTEAYLGCGHHIEIFGDAGTIALRNPTAEHVADGFELSIGTRARGRLEVVSRDPLQMDADGRIVPAQRIVRRFLDAICGGGSVRPNLEDGVHVQRWL